MSDATSPDDYRARILAAVEPMPAYPQPVMECLGLAVAEDVHAAVALPSFDNSAMDGYAVRREDVVTATADAPVHLPVVGEIGAGRATLLALPPGTSAKIMTGAPLPNGADCVVPYEWTDRGVAQVVISQAPDEAQHVRRAGEHVAIGDLVVAEGTVLGPRHLGLLAAVGRSHVAARPRPRVVVLSTGSELREPGESLGHDSIYDSNSYLLAACVRQAGALAYRVGIVPDSPRAWFGPVAMQPGKPQGFGLVGEDRTPILTLPGNPVSSFVSFEQFVLPVLRRMMGIEPEVRPTTTARLTHAVRSPEGKRQFLRGIAEDGAVSPSGGPGSHLLGGLADANCLIVIPEATTEVPAGATVDIQMLEG
jgi:molybdopterin molybdotransferase